MKGIKNHNQTNRLIKLTVIALDFVALWLLLPVVADFLKFYYVTTAEEKLNMQPVQMDDLEVMSESRTCVLPLEAHRD